MPFLALIPTIWSIISTVLGTAVEGRIGQTVMGSVMSHLTSDSPTANGILEAIESVTGKLADAQRLEIQAQMTTLMAQSQIELANANSSSFFRSGCRDTLEWGLSLIVLLHLFLVEIFNVHALLTGGVLQPLDTLTTALLMGLLGLYGAAKTIEKFNSNTSDN